MTADLFSYPHRAGFKTSGTSRDAARQVGDLQELQRLVLEAIQANPSTPDEVAAVLGRSVLGIRPRFSELSKMGKIRPTGARRLNQSKRAAAVWRVA